MVGLDPIEDQICAVDAASDAMAFVARDQRKALRSLADPAGCSHKLGNEGSRPNRTVSRDVVADLLKVVERLCGQDDLHGLVEAIAAYFASSLAATSSRS